MVSVGSQLRRVTTPAMIVVACVVILGIGAVSAMLLLEQRVAASRAAQISLSKISAGLTELELLPLSGAAGTGRGGVPVSVRVRSVERMHAGREQAIRREFAALAHDSHPDELDAASAPLNAAIATAGEAVPVWVSARGFTTSTTELLARQGKTLFAAVQALSRADDAYGRQAAAARTEAIAGTAAMVAMLLAAFAFLYMRSDRQRADLRRLLSQLEHAQQERARLLERSVQVAEHERMRVAADLHDGPIQRLSAVALGVDLLANQLARGDYVRAFEMIEQIRDSMSAETVALRQLMTELRPPILDQRGLAPALADCAEDVFADSDVVYSLDAGDFALELAPVIETVVFRVVHEALS